MYEDLRFISICWHTWVCSFLSPVDPSTPCKHWSVRRSPHRHPVNPTASGAPYKNRYGTAMDFQIWLIPLLSLIGGAAGAAFINGWFGLHKMRRDRADEYDRWLRNEKVEVYSSFVDAALAAYDTVPLLRPRDPDELHKMREDQQIPLARILMVGSEDVRIAAQAVADARSSWLLDLAGLDNDDRLRPSKLQRHGKVVKARMGELQEICREEIGVIHPRKKRFRGLFTNYFRFPQTRT